MKGLTGLVGKSFLHFLIASFLALASVIFLAFLKQFFLSVGLTGLTGLIGLTGLTTTGLTTTGLVVNWITMLVSLTISALGAAICPWITVI